MIQTHTQTAFIDDLDLTRPIWSTAVTSLSFNEQQIIRGIIELHNNGEPFDVDPCYSKGAFWKGLPEPRHKFDLVPQVEGCEQANARNLPFEDESVDSIMFDPPFLIKNTQRKNGVLGKMEKRFSGFPTVAELRSMYRDSMAEFWRILRSKGILVVKCQDTLSGGKQHMIHVDTINDACDIGFAVKDLNVLGKNRVMFAPNMVNQKHARKNHLYFITFYKP